MNLNTTEDRFTIDTLFIGGDPPINSVSIGQLGAGAEAAIGTTLPRGTVVFSNLYSGGLNTEFLPIGSGSVDFLSALINGGSGEAVNPILGITVHDVATDDDGTVNVNIYTGGRFNKERLLEINDAESFAFFDGNAMTDAEKDALCLMLRRQGFDIVSVSELP